MPGIENPHVVYKHGKGVDNIAAITGATFDSSTHPLTTAGSYYFSDVTGKFIKRLNSAGTLLPFATGLPYQTVDLDIDSAGRLYVLSQGKGPRTGIINVIARRP